MDEGNKLTKYSIGKNKNEIVLATVCIECLGEGYRDVVARTTHCPSCDGMGFFTTENGAQILALVADVMKGKR